MTIILGYNGPELQRNSDGTLPRCVDGGYPVVYYCADGGSLCADCANGNNGSLASEDPGTEAMWRLAGADILWEGPPVICDQCGEDIESAYGDPDA